MGRTPGGIERGKPEYNRQVLDGTDNVMCLSLVWMQLSKRVGS